MKTPIELLCWGAFLGVACVLFLGSLVTFVRTGFKVAAQAAAVVAVCILCAMVNTAWYTPFGLENQARFIALVNVLTASFVLLGLAWWLGGLQQRARARRAMVLALGLLSACLLPVNQALYVAALVLCFAGVSSVAQSILAVRAGDHLARLMVAASCCVLVAILSLNTLVLGLFSGGEQPVHVLGAVSAIGFLTLMVYALWARYASVLELRQAVQRGANYDPLTRMGGEQDTAQLLGSILHKAQQSCSLTGVISLTIANLPSLEKLHGTHAVNRALFEFAGRIRRVAGGSELIGRIDAETFVLFLTRVETPSLLHGTAAKLLAALSKNTLLDAQQPKPEHIAHSNDLHWAAQIGVGILVLEPHQTDTSNALEMSRALAISALASTSRMASFDNVLGQIQDFPSFLAA